MSLTFSLSQILSLLRYATLSRSSSVISSTDLTSYWLFLTLRLFLLVWSSPAHLSTCPITTDRRQAELSGHCDAASQVMMQSLKHQTQNGTAKHFLLCTMHIQERWLVQRAQVSLLPHMCCMHVVLSALCEVWCVAHYTSTSLLMSTVLGLLQGSGSLFSSTAKFSGGRALRDGFLLSEPISGSNLRFRDAAFSGALFFFCTRKTICIAFILRLLLWNICIHCLAKSRCALEMCWC